MYAPPPFAVPDPAWCHPLMRRNSFATLVGVDASGVPFATHLPLLLDDARGALGTLVGHVARGNPQWRLFAADVPALAIFQGPHAYVSPSWYESHPSVPTWNYVAVHAYGVPALVEEPARVRALLAALVRAYEGGRATPWRLETLPGPYLDAMIRGIVMFEMPIDRLEGKAKLSQNRDVTDRSRVRAALGSSDDPLERALATLMARADEA